MNKKGFTLIELIIVIAILGLIITIATMTISSLRKKTNEKEIITIRATIESSFNNYRIDNVINDDQILSVSTLNLSGDIYYNNNKCNNNINNNIKYVKKGSYDGSSSLEEVFCIRFSCNEEIIINDYETNEIYCK